MSESLSESNPPTSGTDIVLHTDRPAWRWRGLLLLGIPLLFLVAIVSSLIWVWKATHPVYTARALLYVARHPERVLFETSQNRQFEWEDFANYQRNQIALVKSRPVLNAALRNDKVAELPWVKKQIDPTEALEQRIRADFEKGPELLCISMTGGDPKEIKLLVDAVQQAYFTEIVDKEGNLRQKRLDQLKKLSGDLESQLKGKKATLKQLAIGLGSQDNGPRAAKAEFAKKQLDALWNELLDVKSQQRKLQVKIDLAQRRGQEAADSPPLKADRARYQQELEFLKALEKALSEDATRCNQELDAGKKGAVDLSYLQDEIKQVEEISRRAAAQVQMLQVEIQAPVRVSLFEAASVTKER
jgi:hypothetical protein